MGQATYTRECGPDGNTIVHLHATNSWTTVYVNGQQIHDQNGDGTADLTTGPGVYSIEWWGPSTDGNGVQHPELPFIPLNPFPTVLDIPALTDCAAAPTTTIATTPTTPVDGSTSTTALVPPSTIPQGACPGGCGATPPAIGIATTVQTPGANLPATGAGSDAAFQLAGGLLLVGAILVFAKRLGRMSS